MPPAASSAATPTTATAGRPRRRVFALDASTTGRAMAFPDPLGFSLSGGSTSASSGAAAALGDKDDAGKDAMVQRAANEAKLVNLKKKRAMEMALQPGKQAMMTAFMMWMSGGGIHIFSIMILGMALWQPLKALSQVNAYFAPLQASSEEGSATPGESGENATARASGPSVDLTQAKLTYVAACLFGLIIALYRMSQMGLLPLTSADWISLLEPKRNLEVSGGGFALDAS